MRSFAHWTPAYVIARSKTLLDRLLQPNDPWFTRESIGLLSRLLRKTDIGLEFGSGRSTSWLANRIHELTSVEDNLEWHQRVMRRLESKGLCNVDLRYCARDLPELEGINSAYVRVFDGFAAQSLDLVFVDGVYRSSCAIAAIEKLKFGGLFVLDNANWFLPCSSRAPNSRSETLGPSDENWQKFAQETAKWRRIWTSNGVWDTLILFKN